MLQDSDANTLLPISIPEPLLSILVRYSALVPIKSLSLPPNTPFNVAHDFFLRKLLLNDHLKRYPPSESYQQSFWKWALVQLESLSRSDEDNEIDECIYTHYLSLSSSEDRSGTPPNSFITHYWKFPGTQDLLSCYETITLLESRTTIEAGTTGLRTWRASLVLAQYLIHHPYLVNTKSVLELGSGTGFIGILVASLQLHGASSASAPDRKVPSIYMTDVNPTVLARCQNNVALPCNKSFFHPNVHYESLDWLDSLSNFEGMRPFFDEVKLDIVLGADIVFDPTLVPPLVRTISLALSSENPRLALIALTVRNRKTLSYFVDEIEKVLQIKELFHDVTRNPLLQVPDQVDAELEVKIFQVTREKDAV